MRILIVSDGRRGIENQALGLAEAFVRQAKVSCEILTHRLSHRPTFSALPPSIQLSIRKDFGLPAADIIIGCGRQAIAPLLSLKRQGVSGYVVYVQDPRMEPSRFDLVVAPEHDGLSGPFVETLIGSPNRITRDRIIGETLAHAERLSQLSMPRAMIAIGGPSKTHDMDPNVTGKHLDSARTLLSDGYSLMVTTSRRTPETAVAQWKTLAETTDKVWLHDSDSSGPNPYFAFLGGADLILVSEDSTNMLTEACTTGKPVFRLPMAGHPGKFQRLYDALDARCGLRRWDGTYASHRNGSPLAETDRVARRILERISSAGQTLN